MSERHYSGWFVSAFCLLSAHFSVTHAAEPVFLRRSIADISEQTGDLTTSTAHYAPLFGRGDPHSSILQGVVRFGVVTVESGGASAMVRYPDEEQLYFVLDGTGCLHYGEQRAPLTKNDFMYLPVGVDHGLSNPRENPLRVIVMGYRIPPGADVPPTPRLMLACADDVPLQILGSHGPTSQFKLLLGTTQSTRDRLAAAHQVNSLFLMDFSPGGTNIPHRHRREEEIYYVLRGHGQMVAGETADGKEQRHPAREGDAFYFSPSTLIGFYSGTKPGEDHAQVLAVRSKCPVSDGR